MSEQEINLMDDLTGIINSTSKENLVIPLIKYIQSNYGPKERPTCYRVVDVCYDATDIIQVVTAYYNISIDDLVKYNRRRKIIVPRQICTWLLLMHTRISLRGIGEILGGRDHTTVIHARDTLKDLMDVYPEFGVIVRLLQNELAKKKQQHEFQANTVQH